MTGSCVARIILHLDMDAFYAAVEVRDDPRLRGKPLIIGHRGRRGVVATCSYEARAFGVRSAMPSLTAERLCPSAIWLPGRMAHYRLESQRVRAVLDLTSPCVEPVSIDEAFADLSGIALDFGHGERLARELKQRIREELALTASVGIAPNKFLAKIASDIRKPDGLVVLTPDKLGELFHPLAVERLWGVGPKTAARLRAGGVARIEHILHLDPGALELLVGARLATHLRALAHGRDDRPVETQAETKSISEERTYASDLCEADAIDRELLARADGVARQLRSQGLHGKTVQLKVRLADYTTWTRAVTLARATDLTEPIVAAARSLLRERIDLGGQGVRLVGVGVSGLARAGSGQAGLFADEHDERSRRLARAQDAVRDKLGEDSLTRARLL